jgi:hypothetical protein
MREVVPGSELERVDEDADDHTGRLGPGGVDERQMSGCRAPTVGTSPTVAPRGAGRRGRRAAPLVVMISTRPATRSFVARPADRAAEVAVAELGVGYTKSSEMCRSPNATMSRSRVRAPQRSRRTRPRARPMARWLSNSSGSNVVRSATICSCWSLSGADGGRFLDVGRGQYVGGRQQRECGPGCRKVAGPIAQIRAQGHEDHLTTGTHGVNVLAPPGHINGPTSVGGGDSSGEVAEIRGDAAQLAGRAV